MSGSVVRVSVMADECFSDPKPAKAAKLYPKEHGAYAILGVPLAVALVIGGVTPATMLFSIAAVFAFLAHEPMLIVIGCRGESARRATPQAGRVLITRLFVTVCCGLVAFYLSPLEARIGMLLCLLSASIEVAITATGSSRTLTAQFSGLAGLTLPGAVVLAAGGVNIEVAFQFWLLWFFGRVATTAAVRTTIARHRHNSTASRTASICDTLLLIAILICGGGLYAGQPQWLATIPLLLSAIVLRLVDPPPKYLKQMGWSLLAVNMLSGAMQLVIWNG